MIHKNILLKSLRLKQYSFQSRYKIDRKVIPKGKMKRLIKVLLSFSMILSCCLSISAHEKDDTVIYVYTIENKQADEYVKNVAGTIIATQHSLNEDDKITIGSGVKVYGKTMDNELYLYPVYNNGKILGTIELYVTDDGYGEAYSQNLNSLFELMENSTTHNCPGLVFFDNGHICVNIDESSFDTNGNIIKSINSDSRINTNDVTEVKGIKTLEENVILSTGSGYCSWTVYSSSYRLELFCGPITIWNIQKNMGYNDFPTWNDLATDMTNVLNLISYGATIEDYHVTNYLHAKNYTNSWITTGYMPIGSIHTMTYTNGEYGVAFSKNTETGKGHITAIIGYSSSSVGDYAILFDPHGSGNCRITININTRTFTSTDVVYYWNYGYVYNIRKN